MSAEDRYLATSYLGDARLADDEGDTYSEYFQTVLEGGNTVGVIEYGPEMDVFAAGDGTLYYLSHTDNTARLEDSVELSSGRGRALATNSDGEVYVGFINTSTVWKFSVDEDNNLVEEWTYSAAGDTCMASVGPTGEVAIGLQNGDIEIIRDDGSGATLLDTYSTGFPSGQASVREIVFNADNELIAVTNDNQDPNFVKVAFDPDGEELSEVWAFQYEVENAFGGGFPGMAVNPDDEAFLADESGKITKWDVSPDDEPVLIWEYDMTPGSDGEFENLAHQAAHNPVTGETWGCTYNGEIHKIEEVDGDPQQVFVDDDYADTDDPEVREVKVYGEHVGTWPEEWPGT